MRRKTKIKNLPNEIWKDIKGYEGLYQVSNLGRVKSFVSCTDTEKILKIRTYRENYQYVGLSKMGIVSKFKIHRLVALAYIINADNKPHIDHINGIRSDNRADNLRWVTPEENMNNPLTKAKSRKINRGESNGMKKFRKPIACINPKTNKIIKVYPGLKYACRVLGADSANISRCANGKIELAYGFKWAYV